ncbi:MAG: aldo/keto reductase [Eubacteriales bacterium]|nr:aldo/keto reductase [Eubacteriales bacterium]
MKILVLNGSPRPHGNTAAMVSAFAEGARESGHEVTVVPVCQRKIAGCLACEYCHTKEQRVCVQKDDMQEIYPVLDEADMIVLASPVYYHSFTGQLQCAINRIYALDRPLRLKKAALLLSSGSEDVYGGALYEYENSFLGYLKLENMGVFTMLEKEEQKEQKWKEIREFGKSLNDAVPSRLGMGVMRLPVRDGDYGSIDYEKAKAIIDRCMEAGITYYDTAYIYHEGKSEEFLGKALREYPRNRYFVADKYNMQANPDYRAQFAEQLKRLQMDYIDFYLLHGIQDSDADEILENGCIAYFDALRKKGTIRRLGFSFHGSPAVLRRCLEAYSWDFVQIQLNYYDWYFGDARELYEILTEARIPVMVMETVHGGLLANLNEDAAQPLKEAAPDRSLASWAVRWVLDLPNVWVALSGMSTLAQLEDNLRTYQEALPLTEKEQECIREAAQKQRAAVAVACTACRYCCPGCPAGLDIPALLKAYNDAKLGGAWRLANLLSLEEGKRPSACISCGSCTRHCPQGFQIPKYMREMAEMMGQE